MRSLFLLALLTTAPALAARPEPALVPSSPLHGYVLGRAAFADDALATAAQFFDAARAQDPAEAGLIRRTFDLAVASGDRTRAFDLARQIALAGNSDPDVALIRLSDAVLKKDWKAAEAARTGLASAGYAAVVGPIVDAWLLHGRGQGAAALAKLDPALFNGFARAYIAEQRAHMLAAEGQWRAAATAYAELRAGTGPGISFLRAGEADALAESGDKTAALALLTGDEPTVVAARTRLMAGKRIGALAPDARRGIGWMAGRLAADLSRERPVPLALLFARAATFLAGDIPATWLICGDVLARSGQQDSALAAWQMIPPGDALGDAARARRAEALEALERGPEAGALLLGAAQGRDARPDDWTRLGDWHRRADRFPDAIAAYSRAITLAGDDATWGLWFLRGSVKERAQDWPGAEADLRIALGKSPDEPVVLNYLGYSLLDRGLKLAEATMLIERAAKLRPGDGGIIDSLGWAQYRQGQFAQAVETLEKAALLEPVDPTVTDHLGDAYWRVGRRIEARFRWRAALALEPSDTQRRDLQAKLDYGLDAALALTQVPGLLPR